MGTAHFITFVTVTEASVYHKIQDLRLLARRDDGQIDPELEAFRLEFFQAFEAWMDNMPSDLTPFIVTADEIIAGNRDLLKWLKREFEKEANFG
jgi:hypothetical protein